AKVSWLLISRTVVMDSTTARTFQVSVNLPGARNRAHGESRRGRCGPLRRPGKRGTRVGQGPYGLPQQIGPEYRGGREPRPRVHLPVVAAARRARDGWN